MDAIFALSNRELTALKSIHIRFVGSDYWDHETIRLNRGLGLVWTDGKRIKLTEAVMRTSNRAWCDDAAIARWLHETAVRLHPESRYARTAAAGDAGRVLRQLSCEPS